MNARADVSVTAQVIPLPLTRRRLAEASIVPIAKSVSAIVFDAPPDGGKSRPRLTALFAGEALRGPSISTSLELRSGGRRHLLVVGRSAASLTGLTVTLALGPNSPQSSMATGCSRRSATASRAGARAHRGRAAAAAQAFHDHRGVAFRARIARIRRGGSPAGRGWRGLRRWRRHPGAGWVPRGSVGELPDTGGDRRGGGRGADRGGPDRVARLAGWQLMVEPTAKAISYSLSAGAGARRATLAGLGKSQIQLLAPART